MKITEAITRRFNIRKILKRTVIFLFVFSITGFFVLPPIIKSVALRKLSARLHREVSIQAVRFNPFMLSLTIRGFAVNEPKSRQPFITFEELYLNLQTMSLIRRGIVVKEILLKSPYIHIVRNEDLTFNFTDLLKMKDGKADDKTRQGVNASPLRFSLNNIQVLGARIDFMDGPQHISHTITDAVLTVPFVSNLPYYLDKYVQPAFSATVNGHPVAFKGNTKPFTDSLETHIDLNIKDLDIPHYLAYSPVPLDFKFVSGFFDTLSSISYVQYKDRSPTLSFKGRTSFRQIRIADMAGAPLVIFPRIDISVASSDLMTPNIHMGKIDVQSPEIHVMLDKAGRLNLASLIPERERESTQKDKEESDHAGHKVPAVVRKKLPVIAADEMLLSGGKIILVDASGDRNFKASLDNITAKVSRFSTIEGKTADAEISFQTDAHESCALIGRFSLEPLAAEGTVNAAAVILKRYAPYYRPYVLIDVEDGTVDLRARYQYHKGLQEPVIQLSELQAAVKALRLRKADETEDFFRVPELSVKDLEADLVKKEMSIGAISSRNGFILGKRYRIGTLLFATLMKVSEQVKPSAEARESVQRKEAVKTWDITLDKLLLSGYTIKFDDRMPEDPVVFTMNDVTLKGENISTVKQARGRISLSMKIEKKGKATANGTVSIEPASMSLKVVTKDIPLLPVQAYLTDRINVYVTDGTLSSDGILSFSQAEGKSPRVLYKGTVSVNHFGTIDKFNAEDLLTWNSLYLNDIDFRSDPLSATINEVALTDFYSRIIVNPDGTLNLQNLVRTEQSEKEETASNETAKKPDGERKPAAAEPVPSDRKNAQEKESEQKMVTIKTVTLQGGTINFTDNYIKPHYTANLLEIGGRVSGLSSDASTLADVDLKGRLDNYAPLEITGKINPLRDDLFVDLKADFSDIDLSPLTPYSGRYLGYTVEKGKVSLNLQYLIVKKKLDAENKVFLDQFTLGERVESPDATKLPVRLAIALLKNRKGEINLTIPVSGRTDDPDFSIGRVVLKILVNLLVKAATSPFALLGALFGGGEELSYIEFDPGQSRLNELSVRKLDTLVKALHDRPALKLEIEGHADTEKDREGLRQHFFERKSKAQKLKEMVKKGGETVPVDEITMEPAEYPTYLTKAYKEEKFPKPRNIIGMAKDLSVPEMEKLMLTHIAITENDLRQLAAQRALAVKDQVLRSQQVEPERVFLVEPKSIQPEAKENVKDSRVDFKLK